MSQTNTNADLQFYVQEHTLEDLVRYGSGHLGVWVHGYYSEVIDIYVNRKIEFRNVDSHLPVNEKPATWVVTVKHSSGGRDTSQVPDDVTAETNFAMGLLHACQVARAIRNQQESLERYYRRHEAEVEERQRKEREAAAAAKAERAANDAPMGELAAMELVSKVRSVTTRRLSHMLYVYDLGDEQPIAVCVRAGKDGVVRFSSGGHVLAQAAVMEMLAKSSHRSHALAV